VLERPAEVIAQYAASHLYAQVTAILQRVMEMETRMMRAQKTSSIMSRVSSKCVRVDAIGKRSCYRDKMHRGRTEYPAMIDVTLR